MNLFSTRVVVGSVVMPVHVAAYVPPPIFTWQQTGGSHEYYPSSEYTPSIATTLYYHPYYHYYHYGSYGSY